MYGNPQEKAIYKQLKLKYKHNRSLEYKKCLYLKRTIDTCVAITLITTVMLAFSNKVTTPTLLSVIIFAIVNTYYQDSQFKLDTKKLRIQEKNQILEEYIDYLEKTKKG